MTHLATAVKASSTFSPDLALVSMKGTPNSCTEKRKNIISRLGPIRRRNEEEHDDHVLLSVLMDLRQPCLESEKEHRVVKKSKKVEKKGRERRDSNSEVSVKERIKIVSEHFSALRDENRKTPRKMNKCPAAINSPASPARANGSYATCGQMSEKVSESNPGTGRAQNRDRKSRHRPEHINTHSQDLREKPVSVSVSNGAARTHQRRWSADFCRCGTSPVIVVTKTRRNPSLLSVESPSSDPTQPPVTQSNATPAPPSGSVAHQVTHPPLPPPHLLPALSPPCPDICHHRPRPPRLEVASQVQRRLPAGPR
ncbi:hypothetical protein FQN60_002643 [Etheostoma spectabile]|uniref:Uncharacterized protein n=1 Tax=Etheostoma spectabile TaxID=54343 RepID=A0A5J5CGQ0_9PERO|nr:hypothetical protein FQN60_002643 [Etheostoma spectabile]